MSALEQTTYCRRPRSNDSTFDEQRRDPEDVDVSSDDSVPLFLSDFRTQPDLRDSTSLASKQRTSILAWILAGALSGSMCVAAVAMFDSDVIHFVIDKTDRSTVGAKDQSQTRAESAERSAPEPGAPSRDAIASAYQMALQKEVAAEPTRNELTTQPNMLDVETLTVLTTRAKSLLSRGDIGGARLLLERAANARDAMAAFLLAQTYDPVVVGVLNSRSVTPDPALARDWYRQAANLGSAEAQQRLAQLGD
jgi:TPR repeat protein